MKVLQINSVCGVGSTGRIATDLYKVLEEQGHECVIAYGRGTAPEGIKTIKIGTDFDNYMHVAKTRLFDKHGFGSTKATKKFIEKVKEYDPDVIHLHNIHGYYMNIEILFNYLKEANKKVVWTLHDCWAFTGHCSHFDYVGCVKWKYGCKQCIEKKEYPKSILKDNSKWNYERKKQLFTSVNNMLIVTPSKWLANLVKDSFLNKYPIKVINNGIDLESFKPTKSNFREKYNLKDKTIVLGVASVWTEKKGFNYFIELAYRLNDSFKVVMVGVNQKQKKSLSKNILTITRTNNINELAEIYSTADIFINPTLEDTFPTTNLEAMACGTKLITFDTGGAKETLDYGDGILIKKCDLKSLIEAILNLEKYSLKKNSLLLDKICKNKRYKEYISVYYGGN